MTGPLPWDDPEHDVGADMVAHLGRSALDAYPGLDATAAAEMAAAQLRHTFNIAQSSLEAAIRAIAGPARRTAADLARMFPHLNVRCFTEPVMPDPDRPAWKRVDRHTWHGGPVTAADLDIDIDLVAEQTRRALDEHRALASLDYLGQMARGVVRVQTGRDLATYNELDYYAERWSWPKGYGKTTTGRRQVDAWIAEFERATGEKPTVFHWRGRPREHIVVDETRDYLGYDQLAAELDREERDREARRYFLNQYRTEEPRLGRPWGGWTTVGYSSDDQEPTEPGLPAGPAHFFWEGDDGEPRHHTEAY